NAACRGVGPGRDRRGVALRHGRGQRQREQRPYDGARGAHGVLTMEHPDDPDRGQLLCASL
ncbi:MAG: hypothetical protein M3354_03975, partial [Chloroflexota bacterium]|nr:hypothetical protein [Chloroflexota bacterium]